MQADNNIFEPDNIFNQVIQTIVSQLNAFIATHRGPHRSVTASQIRQIVNEAIVSIGPAVTSQAIEHYLEAKCADHLACIVNRSTQRLVNRGSHLSALQNTYLQTQLGSYTRNLGENTKRNKARAILAAALYKIHHNNAHALEALNSMIFPSNGGNGNYTVNTESAEFRRRLADARVHYQNLPVPAEFHQPTTAEPEVPDEDTTSQSEFTLQRDRFLENVRTVNQELQSLTTASSAEERVGIEAIRSQLAAISTALQPVRVAVVGEVSSGKSTFVNNLVGCSELFKSGCGPVTSVVTEIQYAPIATYRASILFMSREQHQADLDFYNDHTNSSVDHGSSSAVGEGNAHVSEEHDEKFNDIEARLMDYYEYDYDDRGIVINFEKPKEKAKNIGRDPVVLEASTMDELRELMDTEPVLNVMVEDELTIDDTVTLIRVEGPFANIPPGVVVLDTPGLGDGEISRSYKTIESLSSVHVVLYTNPIAYQMCKEWDQKILQRIKLLGNLLRDIYVVATKADSEEDRSDKAISVYTRNILNALCLHYASSNNCAIPNAILGNSKKLQEYMQNHMPAEFEDLQSQAERIKIIFTTRESGFEDFQRWREILQHYYTEQREQLEVQQGVARGLMSRFAQSIGQTHDAVIRSVEKKTSTAINSLKAAVDSCLGKGSQSQLSNIVNAIVAKLYSYNAATNTKRAVMNPRESRCGVFLSKSQNRSVHYNLNQLMAEQWLNAIRPAWNQFLGEIQSIQGTLSTIPERGILSSNLRQEVLGIGRAVFEIDVADFMKNVFRSNGVYRVGRNSFPQPDELTNLFADHLRTRIDGVVGRPGQEGAFATEVKNVVTSMSMRSVPTNSEVANLLMRLEGRRSANGSSSSSSDGAARSSSTDGGNQRKRDRDDEQKDDGGSGKPKPRKS